MSRLPAEWIPTGTPHRSMSAGYHAKPPCHNDVCMVMTPAATCCSVGRGLKKPDTKPTVDAEPGGDQLSGKSSLGHVCVRELGIH